MALFNENKEDSDESKLRESIAKQISIIMLDMNISTNDKDEILNTIRTGKTKPIIISKH